MFNMRNIYSFCNFLTGITLNSLELNITILQIFYAVTQYPILLRRSFLSECHTVSCKTRKYDFIYAQLEILNPCELIFTKLANAQQHHI